MRCLRVLAAFFTVLVTTKAFLLPPGFPTKPRHHLPALNAGDDDTTPTVPAASKGFGKVKKQETVSEKQVNMEDPTEIEANLVSMP